MSNARLTPELLTKSEFKGHAASWSARTEKLLSRRDYYDGSVYTKAREQLGWLGPRLYKGIKPLYLPLSRAVDVDAGIIPAGWAFPEDAPDAWAEARDKLWSWSNWQTRGVLYVHYGAQTGVTGLKIADLRDQKRVVVDPVDPAKFMLVRGSQFDDTPAMSIWIEQRMNSDGETFEYAEVITPESVRTFADGEPAGIDERKAEYTNDLGFVPFVEVNHLEIGETLGEATFQKAIPMLDEVNQLASYLGDIIGKHAEPQWAVFGAEATDLERSGDNVWFLPAGADVKPLVPSIDIEGFLEFVREIAANVKNSLPELAFDELRDKDQIATATLELQLMELVLKIKRVRPNYDAGLVKAYQLAAPAAKTMSSNDLAPLDDEDLSLDNERPVLPIDPETVIRLEQQQLELEATRASLNGRTNGSVEPVPQI